MKFWYIQDWGTYGNQTLVFVGYTIPEITKIIKKKGFKSNIVAEWCKDWEGMENTFKNVAGGVWSNDGATVLYLPKWEDNWDNYETLLHECFHLVMAGLAKGKLFVNEGSIEEEGMAYQLEYLFRHIRIKLQKKLSTKKKKKK